MESSAAKPTEKGSGAERRSDRDRTAVSETQSEGAEKRHNRTLEIVGSIVMAVIGLYVYKATGLYSAADSGIVHVALGGGIAWWFVSTFRHAIHE